MVTESQRSPWSTQFRRTGMFLDTDTNTDLIPEGFVKRYELCAPSRLHFGLLSFGRHGGRSFGGAGLMIDEPGLRLGVAVAREFEVIGDRSEQVLTIARTWSDSVGLPLPELRVDLRRTPPQHVGLGSGTTLALGVATILQESHGVRGIAPVELAQSVNRGLRSAVGTYGFLQGGFVVEQGKQPGQMLAPLDCRLPAPAQWRVVLLTPRGVQGLSGPLEQAVFDGLEGPSPKVTEALERELRDSMTPALLRGDLNAFGESVFHYGRLAGECFSAVQGGPYNGPLLADAVARIRGWGYAGVGQSSWGPTLFVLLENDQHVEDFLARWRQECGRLPIATQVTRVDNQGVRWQSYLQRSGQD